MPLNPPRTPLGGPLPAAPQPAAPQPAAPLPTVEQTVTRWVSVPVANVRSGPSTSYRIVGTKTQGTSVKGVLTSNGWLKISDTQYMAPSVLTSTNPGTSSQTVTRWVSVPVANVRSGPSTSYRIVGTRTQGTEIRGTVASNGWIRISDTQYISPTVVTTTPPGGGSGTQVTQYMTAEVGNVRSGPGLNYRVVTTMTRGTQVRGTWTSNGWLNLGNSRYISGTILSSTNPGGSTPAPSPTVDRWVSASVANVRSGPSTSYRVVGTKTAGTKVSGTISTNGWLRISSSQWMSPTVLSTTPPSSAPAPAPSPGGLRGSLIATAKQYVGYPYVLYGEPPNAFDCSAYTWWVYRQNGINIPRTVRDQRTVVTPTSNPQPGDLVFYKKWYHVAIYAGNGMVYDARNASTGVIYAPMLQDPDMWYGRVPGV